MYEADHEEAKEPSSTEYLVVGVVLYLIAFSVAYWSSLAPGQRRALVGLFILIVVGSFFPSSLKPLKWAWSKLAMVLQFVMHRVIWTVLYYGVFVPYALALKLFRADALKLSWGKYPSTWESRSGEAPTLEEMKRPW